jgi:hypothetical protein
MNAAAWLLVMLVSTTGCSSATEAPATARTATAPSTAVTATPPEAAGAPVVEPGKGIGPIRLGMTPGEVEATKLPVDRTRSDEWRAGPYRLLFEDGKVVFIEAQLVDLGGAVFGGATIPPEERSIERIAAQLPSCGKVEMRLGANAIHCAGDTTWVLAAGPPGAVVFHVQTAEYAQRLAGPASTAAKAPPVYPSAGPPCSGGGPPCGPGAKR